MKTCIKCKIEKDEKEFSRDKRKRDGLCSRCKDCIKKYHLENREEILKKQKEYYQENKENKLKKSKEYYLAHKEEKLTKQKKRRDELSEEKKQQAKERQKQWYQENKKEKKDKRKKQQKEKRQRDPIYKLHETVSRSVNRMLKRCGGNKNKSSCLNFLSYTVQELKEHLEKQFEPWMNWNNHGTYVFGGEQKWHIDHIKPHSSFYYETMDCEEFRNCWALENLRPLSAVDNMKKSNKIDSEED